MNKKELITFEERISFLYEQAKIKSPIHLSKGNEDQLISIFQDVKKEDWVFSNWRNHYHALLKGIPSQDLERDILNGNSMHISSKEYKFYSSSLVAGSLPISLGVAMALKIKNSKDHVWSFCGDMAAETGVFHEVTKYASGHDLPVTFIVEDNGLSVDTPTKEVWGESAFNNNGKLMNYSPQERGKNNSSIIRYSYERQHHHHGIGMWIDFPNSKSLESSVKKERINYEDNLRRTMKSISEDERTLFIGQTVKYKGSPIYNSLEDIAEDRRIELPVMEEVQMGISTGLALEGFIPVSIYPRFDFLTLATNQFVNHLDKANELSYGNFNPKVIVRVRVGSQRTFNAGCQHIQDHTEAYKNMLTNTEVVRLEHSSQIFPEYKKAIRRNKSTLLVEF